MSVDAADTSVPIAFRITIVMKTIRDAVGRTPRPRGSHQTRLSEQADVGVGRGPGGPPHSAFKMFSRVSELRSYDEVREKSDNKPDNEVPFFGTSELPPSRSTNPITLFPKSVFCASGFPSMRAFWIAS